jgi:hypothetical protein
MFLRRQMPGGGCTTTGSCQTLGGFAYPPSCTPNHKKIAPPPKNSADARIPEEIGPRRVASLHPYGMVRLPMPGGGRPTLAGGRTNGHYCGLLASPHLLQFAPTPRTVPALPPSAESDRAATHDASPGCGAAADAWGSASDAVMGSNGGPSWWGSAHTKN